jgi:peptidoglycan/LPS O-acetylase OafA/YrhL
MKEYLVDYLDSRENNLDILRFISATLVIFSHSYPLTLGHDKSEPLMVLTNNQTGFGHLAVSIFFIISGVLITQSFDRSKDISYFFRSRVLRIFPALIVVVLLTVFLLGPMVTTLSIYDYFTSVETLKYLILTPTLIFVQYDLPGVFENNPFVGVNGSLWTLWYEFFFYIVVGILGYLKLLNKKIAFFLFISSLICVAFDSFFQSHPFFSFFYSYIKLFIYFGSGMVLYLFRREIKLNLLFAVFAAIALIIGTYFGFFKIFFAMFGSYLIIYLAFQRKIQFANFSKLGDFSYGLYIFAFPIQQTVTFYSENKITPFENFIISFPLTLVFSILSWHLIEKRALMLKKTPILKNRIFNKSA